MASQGFEYVLVMRRILSKWRLFSLRSINSRLRSHSCYAFKQLGEFSPKIGVFPAIIACRRKEKFGGRKDFMYSFALLSCAYMMAGEDEDTRDLETLKTADLLYESNEIRKLYELLSKQKESKNAEILWRLARAARDYSQMSTVSKELKKTLVYEGYKAAEEAVRIDENIFACHKWYGIMLSEIGDYEGTKKKIENSYKIRDHFLKAIELNQKDPTSHYLLGVWFFTFADLPWYQRKLAATIFASPPSCTYEDAEKCFLQAETIDPGFYTANQLMLAKTYARLGKKDEAKEWLNKLLNYAAKTESDKQDIAEGEKLLKSL